MVVAEKGLEIDPRVKIALDGMTPSQKSSVREVLGDKSRFFALMADPSRVETLSARDRIFSLKIPQGLRMIYTRSGDVIQIMDVMRPGVIKRFAPKKSAPRKAAPRKSVAKKAK